MDTVFFSKPIPRMPIQVWLSRIGIVLAVFMIICLQTVGIGHVTTETIGETTVYKFESYFAYYLVPFALAILFLAIVFWIQRGIFRFYSVILISSGGVFVAFTLYFLFMDEDNSHVSVSPSSLVCEDGISINPFKKELDLSKVIYLYINESRRENSPYYELVANSKPDGKKTRIPINYLMKKALPQILANAKNIGVVVADSANGTPIPDGLQD